MGKKNILQIESLSVDERVELGARLFKDLSLVQQRQFLIKIVSLIDLKEVLFTDVWNEIDTAAAKTSFHLAYTTFLKAMHLLYGPKSNPSVGFDYFGGETFFVRRVHTKRQRITENIIPEEFAGNEELAKEMLPQASAKFADDFDRMIARALIAASYEAMSPIYEATNRKFVKEYAGERWRRDESGEVVSYVERIRQTIEDGVFITRRVKQFKPGRLPLTAEQKKARDEERRAKFLAELLKAVQKWYSQGHRKKPRQADLAVIIYPPPKYRRESAESMFSTNLKRAGVKFADIDLNRKPQ